MYSIQDTNRLTFVHLMALKPKQKTLGEKAF
jgi:hypothetical protein